MDRVIRVGWAALALVMAVLFVLAAAGQAQAASRRDEPASRNYVARVVVERALMSDITTRDRDLLWVGSECFADRAFTRLPLEQRRRVCYAANFSYLTGYWPDGAAYPVFRPHRKVTRAQMASVAWCLASFERERMPAHTAVFIDVDRGSTHEPAIRWSAYHGLVCGFDTEPAEFRPDAPVSRRHVRVIVARVVEHWRSGRVHDCG